MSDIATAVRQRIQIPYRYTAGAAVTRFLLGLKERVIWASSCNSCGMVSVPPLAFCGRCWKSIPEFVAVGPQGTLESFAQVPGSVEELPDVPGTVVYGLILLDGATSRLAHLVRAEDPTGLRCGARVEPVWRAECSGHILDVTGFRVLPE